jgi:hypothetical protein
MVTVNGSDGLIETNFFQQDDYRKGRAHTTVVGTQDEVDQFNSLDTNKWNYFLNNESNQVVTRILGDMAYQGISPYSSTSVQTWGKDYPIKDDIGSPNAVIV